MRSFIGVLIGVSALSACGVALAEPAPPKSEPPKAAPSKVEPAKSEPSKAEPAKTAPSKAEPPKEPAPSKSAAPDPKAPAPGAGLPRGRAARSGTPSKDSDRLVFPSDPRPQASKKQWFFKLQIKSNEVSVLKVSSVDLAKPEGTARMIGRFAIELRRGEAIVDRLRFNVPLLGDGSGTARSAGRGRPVVRVNTTRFERMADAPSADTLAIVDRETGETRLFSWPPGPDGALSDKPDSAQPPVPGSPK